VSGLGPSFMKILTCESFREVGPGMPERRKKNVKCASRLSKIWIFFSARSKQFPAAMGDQRRNLVESLSQDTNKQSMEWRRSGSTRPIKFRVQNSSGKMLASTFWYEGGSLFIVYLPKGQTINVKYYTSLLVQFKDILRKNAAGSSPSLSCSCTKMPRLTLNL